MRAPAFSMQRQPVYLFVARSSPCPGAMRGASYEFYARFDRKPPELPCNFTVVSTRRLPRMFCGLARLLDKIEDGCLGYINYTFNGTTAITNEYYPKKHAREVSTLGYFLELISTHDLLRGLADKISTTLSPSQDRILQLRHVHLPVGREMDAHAWARGISQAIRLRAEKLRRLAAMGKAA